MCTVIFFSWTHGVIDYVCIAIQVDSTNDHAVRSVGLLSHQHKKELKSTVSELYNGTQLLIHIVTSMICIMCYFLDDNEIILNSLKGLSSVNLCSWTETKLTILSAALVNITCVYVAFYISLCV